MTGRGLRSTTRIALASVFMLAAANALAAQADPGHGAVSVAGQWEITLHNDQQSFDWNVTFEQEGQVLTGFAETSGRVFPLEGTLDGTDITFYVTVDEPDHDEPLMFMGSVDGHEASGVMDPTGGQYPEALMDWFGKMRDGS